MARHDALLAENAARAQQQDGAERDADHDDLQRRGARLLAGRKQAGDGAGRRRPDAPDQHRAEDRAAIVAGAADDQHRPDLEGQHRHVIVGRDEADEMRLHRAGQPHDAAADGEGLQPEVSSRSCRAPARPPRPRGWRAAPGPTGCAPAAPARGRAATTTATSTPRLSEAEERADRRHSSAKGRGMKPMPNGPPVTGSRLSATSCTTTATPKVAMAR